MADDRRLDPITADFVDADAGAFEQCDVIENQIAFSYLIPLGSWEGDTALGHRFNELSQAVNSDDNRKRLRDMAGQAVQWLIDLGSVDHVVVTVDAFSSAAGMDGVAWEVDYYLPGDAKPKKAGPFLISVGGG